MCGACYCCRRKIKSLCSILLLFFSLTEYVVVFCLERMGIESSYIKVLLSQRPNNTWSLFLKTEVLVSLIVSGIGAWK